MSPATRLTQQGQRLLDLERRLAHGVSSQLRRGRERLVPLARTLNAVSPLATLERGYAIVSMENGVILRDAAEVAPGTIIEARLARGRLRAKVEGAS